MLEKIFIILEIKAGVQNQAKRAVDQLTAEYLEVRDKFPIGFPSQKSGLGSILNAKSSVVEEKQLSLSDKANRAALTQAMIKQKLRNKKGQE